MVIPADQSLPMELQMLCFHSTLLQPSKNVLHAQLDAVSKHGRMHSPSCFRMSASGEGGTSIGLRPECVRQYAFATSLYVARIFPRCDTYPFRLFYEQARPNVFLSVIINWRGQTKGRQP